MDTEYKREKRSVKVFDMKFLRKALRVMKMIRNRGVREDEKIRPLP